MNSSISSSKFLRRYVALLVAGAVLIGGWNLFVDPFDIYHGISIPGWTDLPSRQTGAFDRMTKARQIARLKPDGLLLGTSRVDWAIDVNHPALQAVSSNYFNAALAGATMYELYRTVQHAQAIQPLKQIIIGLDVETFNPREDIRGSFSESRLAVTPNGRPNRLFRVTDLVPTLFTLDALRASSDTVERSRDGTVTPHEELDPEQRWRAYKQGVHEARANLARLGKFTSLIARRLDDYADLLRFAHQQDIDLRMFITPYHVSHLEVIRTSGNWRAFDWWKGELHRINQEIARDERRTPFALWDFSGYHAIATESFPSPTDKYHVMAWYQDSSHYRKKTGDLILDRVFGHPISIDDFGVEITPNSIRSLLSYQQKTRDRYLAERPSKD